jgi:hypothetical protein
MHVLRVGHPRSFRFGQHTRKEAVTLGGVRPGKPRYLSLPRNGIRDGFHSVPDFSFEDGDAVERVPTYAFIGLMPLFLGF